MTTWLFLLFVVMIFAGIIVVDGALTPAGCNVGYVVTGAGVIGFLIMVAVVCISWASARDLDGRYVNSPLKPWFDHLASGKGLCCSMADGFSVTDADWETRAGHYRVRIPARVEDDKPVAEMVWVDVPDDAVITEPNQAGRTMVWPLYWGTDSGGVPTIRCFMPGSMT